MPKDGKRAIVRCRDDHYLTPFPALDLAGCRALHIDGHQADAALSYAQRCRKAGILTSLDGGGAAHQHPRAAGVHRRRDGGRALLRADGQDAGGDARLSEEPRLQDRRRDARRARRALVRRERRGAHACRRCRCRRRACATPAARATCSTAPMSIPISTIRSKAGRSISGSPSAPSAYKIQHLGNEAGLPTLEAIEAVAREFDQDADRRRGRRARTSRRCARSR